MRRVSLLVVFLLTFVVVVDVKANELPPCSLSFIGPLESVLCGKDKERSKPESPPETTTTTALPNTKEPEETTSTTISVRSKQELPVTG